MKGRKDIKTKEIKPGVFAIAYDFVSLLKQVTGYTKWKEINGPSSGVGLDYWYRSGKHEAYINLDQGHVTISMDDDVIYEGEGIIA